MKKIRHLKSTVVDSWSLATDKTFLELVRNHKATFSAPRYAEIGEIKRSIIDIMFVNEADATWFLLKYNAVKEDETEI